MKDNSLTFLIFLLISSIVILSCKDHETDVSPAIEKTAESKPMHRSFLVIVDDLRVRTSPNLKSEVIGKLKEGSLVQSSEFPSDNVDTISLRGVKKIAPYYKINDHANLAGWVYGGALQLVYQDTLPPPFTDRFGDFVRSLHSQDKNKVTTGKKILDLVNDYQGGDKLWNDVIYNLASQFFSMLPDHTPLSKSTISSLPDSAYNQIFYNHFDMNFNEETRDLYGNGYILEASEGDIYAIRNQNALAETMRGPFSEMLERYIEMIKFRNNHRFYEDAAIVVPLNTLVDYAIMLEKFLIQYPEFLMRNQVEEQLESTQNLIINGLANTPSKDSESDIFRDDFKEAWEYYLKTYPATNLSVELAERL